MTPFLTWRVAALAVGLAGAVVAGAWNTSAAWPVVLGGRILTVVGVAATVPALCTSIGGRLARSDVAGLSIVGARLRRPPRSLVRSVAALAAGLYLFSSGTALVAAVREDPEAVSRAYSSDGYRVVEVRGASEAALAQLSGLERVQGSSASTDGAGHLTGSCQALRHVTGDPLEGCTPGTYRAVVFAADEPPIGDGTQTLRVRGPRAEVLSGLLVTVTAGPPTEPPSGASGADSLLLVPLPSDRAERLYDTLLGADPALNVRIVGAASVSGATELDGILDVFRWGVAFAVAVCLAAALVAVVGLTLDRQAGSTYLSALGLPPSAGVALQVTEVLCVSGAGLAVSFVSALVWTWSLPEPAGIGAVELASPFLATFAGFTALVTAVVAATRHRGRHAPVPHHDDLAAGDLVDVARQTPRPSPRPSGRR